MEEDVHCIRAPGFMSRSIGGGQTIEVCVSYWSLVFVLLGGQLAFTFSGNGQRSRRRDSGEIWICELR